MQLSTTTSRQPKYKSAGLYINPLTWLQSVRTPVVSLPFLACRAVTLQNTTQSSICGILSLTNAFPLIENSVVAYRDNSRRRVKMDNIQFYCQFLTILHSSILSSVPPRVVYELPAISVLACSLIFYKD